VSTKDCGLQPAEIEYLVTKRKQERTTFTRRQWWAQDRYVFATDAEAVKHFFVNSTGQEIFLFSEEQTRERDY
jgi:hypothetical protein